MRGTVLVNIDSKEEIIRKAVDDDDNLKNVFFKHERNQNYLY